MAKNKTFRIPIVWQVMGWVEVEAPNLIAAAKKVGEDDGTLFEHGLPDGNFLEETMGMDKTGVVEMAKTKKEADAIKKLPEDYWR